jgi:hypothetical protein
MILSCPGAIFMKMIVTDRIIGVYGQVLAPSGSTPRFPINGKPTWSAPKLCRFHSAWQTVYLFD